MGYRDLNSRVLELHRKYKELQGFCKDHIVRGEKSFELYQYEKELFKQYCFYANLKRELSKGGEEMACGKKGKGGGKR